MSISVNKLSGNVIKNLEIDASDVSRFKIYENLTNVQIDLLNTLPLKYLRDGQRTVLFNLVGFENEYQWPSDLLRFVWLRLRYSTDVLEYSDAAITASDNSLASDDATFVAGDVGKNVAIVGAGAAGAIHYTSILTFQDANTVLLADNAVTTVAGARYAYGTAQAINTQNPAKEALELDQDIHSKPLEELGTIRFPYVDTDAQDSYVISPEPKISITDGGLLRYVYNPPAITAGQDSILNPNLQPLLEYGATALSALVDDGLMNPAIANIYESKYDKELAKFLPKKDPDK